MNLSTVVVEARPFKPNVFDKYHKGHDRKYSRVVCGIGWPSEDKAGALVVIGEELVISPTKTPKLYWFAEYESHSISSLMEKAIEFKTDLYIESYIAQRGHEGYIQFRNKEARERREPEIYIRQALKQDGGLEYYLALINDLGRIGNPRLHLGKQSRLPGVLQQMPDSVAGLSVKDYPLLAALGFAVDPLTQTPYRAEKYDHKLNRVETEYDLFKKLTRS